MFYRETDPGPELSSLVKCIWVLERDYRGPFPDHEHLWADANGELLFTTGSGYYLQGSSGRRVLSDCFVIGPCTRAFDLYSDGETALVGARFFPWGFHALAERPVGEIIDRLLPAQELFGESIVALGDRLSSASRDERVALLTQFLRDRAAATSRRTDVIQPIGSRIIAQGGRIAIAELAREFDIAPRRLERLFRAQTGLSPKAYSRIVRFNEAKRLIERDPTVNLAQLTSDTGYADQAHFSKTFREMFGITPGLFKHQVTTARALLAANDSTVAFLQDS